MAEVQISAQERDPRKVTNQALRRAGMVPAVYYNRKGDVRCLQFERFTLDALLRKEVGLLKVDVNGESLDCIIREVQRHPVFRQIIHIDLMGIVKGQKITAHIAVHPVGIAAGIKEGGALELVLRELEVECEPANLPTHIDIDVSGLNMNEGIHVSDIHYEGVTILADPHATVVHVVPPKAVVEATTVAAAGVTSAPEPEVIREKKVEGEAAAPEKKEKGKK
jgi:large subunit ribosomal protein L25